MTPSSWWISNLFSNRYINSGTSKFGSLTISNAGVGGEESALHFRLFIDGAERWGLTLRAPPVPEIENNERSFWALLRGYSA